MVQPLITEKATDLVAQNKYCFIVPVNVNKTEVAKRIKSVYGVKPTKVNFVQVIGKKVRTGRRIGKRKDFKKAIITLNKEDKIELYEGV
ncbi:MAG: 50S ribosomal protein L23 [Patescibacteria group bacterium]